MYALYIQLYTINIQFVNKYLIIVAGDEHLPLKYDLIKFLLIRLILNIKKYYGARYPY